MNTTDEPSAGDRIGTHYEVVGQVARGGMASVIAVRDVRTTEVLALKLLLPLDGTDEAQNRFRREFRAMSRLHHQNVLRVHESGIHRGRPWFTMELLEGHDLRVEAELLQVAPAPERFARIESLLKQVARALAYVHERGLVHRDVTPGNLMVLPDGTLKLMDFGVVKEDGGDMTAVGELIGTVAYMAPEQITGDAVDERTDLYSLGAVLYLMLTGKRPFQAHTIHGFMEKHLHQRPRPPRELCGDVPEHLEAVCMRLLEKAPAARFASAWHLLHTLGDVETGDEPEGRFPPRTVGRTAIKSRLREAIDEVATGRAGHALLLSGPMGIGKSRLVDVATLHAQRLGLPVAVGRCRAQDRPFAPFTAMYRELRPEGGNPLLDQLLSGNDARIERYSILTAFKDLVVARAPLMLVLDDIDRGDPASIELLVYLVRNTLELATDPVLFLMGLDSAETRIRAQVESLNAVGTLEVPALEAAEVEELVVGVLGSSPATLALASRIQQEGNGSPAFIADMLRGLVDDGLIVEDITGTWRLTVDASQITRSQLPMPASLRQALAERLAPLGPDAREVGRTLALARRRVDLDVVLHASTLSEERVMEGLDALVEREIVTETRTDDDDVVELSHGRFREVLLEGVSEESLAAGHRRLGEALERHHRHELGVVYEDLAWHFEHAALLPKAYAYLGLAGQRHLERGLYAEAIQYLERALGLESEARPSLVLDEADRRLTEVHLSLSRARHALGEVATAVEHVTVAQRTARQVRDAKLEARVSTELGTQLRQAGRVEDAARELQSAVEQAELAGDQTLLPTPLYELGAVCWSRGNLTDAEQHWRRSLTLAQQTGDERAQARGFNGLAILALSRGQQLDARKWLEQATSTFERLGMLSPLVVSRVNLIELYVNTGVLRKAQSLAERTFAQSDEVGLPEGVALGRGWRARILLLLGRVDEARKDGLLALEASQRTGNIEDQAFTLATLCQVALAEHKPGEALERAEQILGILRIHDHERVLHEILGWKAFALSELGHTAEAEAVLDTLTADTSLWPHVRVRTDLAQGRALTAVGRQDAAREVLHRALAVSEANGFRTFQLATHAALAAVTDETTRDRHNRIAAGIARSLAANLPTDDAERFLAFHGVTGH
jgi:tetratricopeptide (TPR) repeat protein